MQHDLKTWPENFERIEQGHLTVTVRENDRPFASGDVINFQEFEPDSREVSHPGGRATGREVRRQVNRVFDDIIGVQKGFVVITFVPVIDR
jgi:hypothetical protein